MGAALDSLSRRLMKLHGVLSVDESEEAFWVHVTDMGALGHDDIFKIAKPGRSRNEPYKMTVSGKPVYKIRYRDMAKVGPLEDALKVELEKAGIQ